MLDTAQRVKEDERFARGMSWNVRLEAHDSVAGTCTVANSPLRLAGIVLEKCVFFLIATICVCAFAGAAGSSVERVGWRSVTDDDIVDPWSDS